MKPNLAEVLPFQDPAVQEFEAGPVLHAVPNLPGQLEITPPKGVLSLVPDHVDTTPTPIETEPARLINSDAVSELFAKRLTARERATRILAKNSYLLHNGRAQEVPGAVDALGTAKQVVKVEQQFGTDSAEHKEVSEGLDVDNRSLVGEAATKNKAVHFHRVRRIFKGAHLGYFANGLSLSTMADNGLSPLAEPEEQPRRITEAVEENGTLVPIGSIIAERGLRGLVEVLPIKAEPELPTVSVQVKTISRCPMYAKENHKLNPKGSHAGLRPAMDGMAIRQYNFEDDTGDREDEQVIISGIYITKEVIEEILVEDGVIEPDQELTVDEMLGMQLISVNGGSLMDFVQRLDKKAGEVHGINIFMGEKVPADHPKDYGQFMEDSEEQRNKLEPIPAQLSELQIDLEKKGIDSQLAEALINKFLKTRLLAIAKNNPELAEAIFDKATAEGFAKVARLEASGRHIEANWLQAHVEKNAPEVSYCSGGGGGCKELESVNPLSLTGKLAVDLGLRGTMVHNTVAACTNCNEKQLHHDYHGNTVCVACKSTKLSGQSVQDGKSKESSDPKAKEQTTQESAGEAPLILLDEMRIRSKKAAAREQAPLPRKAGEVVQLHAQPPKQSLVA